MPRLTIDGKTVDVPDGATLLDAARQVEIRIPTLCYDESIGPLTSCMLCVVKDTRTGLCLPACASKAEEGMVIETNTEDVRAARRDALQLLLSEHTGDCEAPCRRICPAALDVPRMMALVESGKMEDAALLAKSALILPITLGWVCSAPCERGCHRGAYDEPLLIREMHRRLGEQHESALRCADAHPRTGKRVAIVGGGAAGLAAAWALCSQGHACRMFEKRERLGGPLRELDGEELPPEVLDAEVGSIAALGVEVQTQCEVGRDLSSEELLASFDAVLVTCDGIAIEAPNLFTATEYAMTVSAVADGKRSAARIAQFLRGEPSQEFRKPYQHRLDLSQDADKAGFIVGRAPHESVPQGRQKGSMQAEARRCLQCDCLKPITCKLRQYAAEYGADQFAYGAGQPPPVEAIHEAGPVVYEPGKCIRCGLCVEITARETEELGLAFTGRGFDVRVKPPFSRNLSDALTKTAARCVELCPTGALAYRHKEK